MDNIVQGAKMDTRSLFEGSLVVWTSLDPEKDAAQLSKWTFDPEFVRHHFDGVYRPYMVSEIKKKFKEDLKKADERRQQYYFGIREKEGERLVGLLRFAWVQAALQYAGLVLDFEDETLAEKYFDETLEMAMRYAFMELNLHRLYVVLPGFDVDAIGRYEQAGFLRETQRRQARFRDGQYYDELIYAILKPEWKDRIKEKQQ